MLLTQLFITDCTCEDIRGFVRKVCWLGKKKRYQCPRSLTLYRLRQNGRRVSRHCPEDKTHYSSCYQPTFTPLVVNNTLVAVCGHYVCDLGYYVFRDMSATSQQLV